MTATLPQRRGERPRTTDEIPHSQVDQQPADRSLTDAVIDEARTWPHVHEGESGISVEGARALVLDRTAAAGPADAFMVGTEFCHGHAQGDYSFHAALPAELAAAAEQAGWAEPHFLAATGQVPPTVVMIYAPRDETERATVLELVRSSYHYALGANP
jgi:phospholipase/carboxylesterase